MPIVHRQIQCEYYRNNTITIINGFGSKLFSLKQQINYCIYHK